jgi:hypothetical protein
VGEKSLKDVLGQVVELEAAKGSSYPPPPPIRIWSLATEYPYPARVETLALSGQTANRGIMEKPTTTQKRVKAVENWGLIPSLHTQCIGKGKYDSLTVQGLIRGQRCHTAIPSSGLIALQDCWKI